MPEKELKSLPLALSRTVLLLLSTSHTLSLSLATHSSPTRSNALLSHSRSLFCSFSPRKTLCLSLSQVIGLLVSQRPSENFLSPLSPSSCSSCSAKQVFWTLDFEGYFHQVYVYVHHFFPPSSSSKSFLPIHHPCIPHSCLFLSLYQTDGKSIEE